MSTADLFLLALALVAAGGVLALLAYRSAAVSSGLAVAGAVAGCALGLVPAVRWLLGEPQQTLHWAWTVPGAELTLGADPLTGFFLVPLFGLAIPAAIFGRGYLMPEGKHRSLGPPWFFFNVLLVSMAAVIVARSAFVFLVAWEAMSLSSFLLVGMDHHEPNVRRASWVYLISAHLAVAVLLIFFLTLGAQAGTLEFDALRGLQVGGGTAALFVLMGLVGFGVKAGFVPFHVWLPEAHAAAPSHVSAMMSGVLINVGLYGFLRVLTFFAPAPWWGPALMALGLAGGLLGIALGLLQRDLKRVLAYSSIENMGLVLLGLGTGFWGLSNDRPAVAALGFAGGLLHVWNHAAMKGLLFLTAGSVLHGAGTRDLEKLGGLLKRMPRTGVAMMLGALAIAGLPPLNGFASEWLLYLGLSRGGVFAPGATGVATLGAVALLAAIGAMALLAFVRLVGIALLGNPRSEAAAHAHESPASMTAPLLLLSVVVIALGAVPHLAVGGLALVATQLGGEQVGPQLTMATAPLELIGSLGGVTWVALAALWFVLAVLLRQHGGKPATAGTWDCGYAAPSARMQYSGRAFSELIAGRAFPPALRPHQHAPRLTEPFPGPSRLTLHYDDPVTRGVYEPFFSKVAGRFARLRWMQQGVLHVYVLYIVLVIIVAFAWMSARRWLPL